ncbi:hypothetical protein HRG_003732 [Hirsutella rhossiliensis]|uniref:Uncharacterized protein n=1 Tax=Hirsutella rhossiliensis TaxID=111463 RepID=A0A9P8SKA2_9HYPO|nr:uncharacterized protein HRG_03732 [Hirsutella rhossiliensis]KAH0965716.1 hypothetical protein HRG_03732 [Hirsutella rhossiliensis]
MQCYERHSVSENCLGTKVLCDRQGPESEQCFQSRKRPQFQIGLEENCKVDPSRSSEACVGTEEWCGRGPIVKIWGSSKNCIDYRHRDGTQQSHPWEEGSGCHEKTEGCLGTFSWCALYYWATYSSQEACFGDRKPRPTDNKKGPWKFPDVSYFADSEISRGTEALCTEIRNPEIRTSCYNAREPAPWRFPFSADCPVTGDLEDERCMGSQAWCEYQKGIYGTLEGCLSIRQRAPKHSNLDWKYGEDCAKRSEKCLGTLKACSLFERARLKQDCVAARWSPGFILPNSKSCNKEGEPNERCSGTFEWCVDHWSKGGYSGEAACFSKHGFDAVRFENSIISLVAPAVQEKILDVAQNVTTKALFQALAVDGQSRQSAMKSTKEFLAQYFEKLRTALMREGWAEQAVKKALSSA